MTAESHIETVQIFGRRLGRRAPSNKQAILFGDIRTGTIPAHPLIVNYFDAVHDWNMLGNDQWGDCGPVSVANLRALVSRVLTGVEKYPSLNEVIDLYERSGNPIFPAEDNGVDMQTMLEEVHKGGIGAKSNNVKCVAFAKVDTHNLEEVRAAIAIFGGLLLGVNLDTVQQVQTSAGGPWDYESGSSVWGGHAVLSGAYTSLTGKGQGDLGLVTWAQVLQLTDDFWRHQVEEAWVVVWPENLGTTQFQQGVNLDALAEDYKELTNRVLPLPPSPSPAPTPVPVPVPPTPTPDAVVQEIIRVWKDLGDWLRRHGII